MKGTIQFKQPCCSYYILFENGMVCEQNEHLAQVSRWEPTSSISPLPDLK